MSKYTFKPYSAIFPILFREEKERIAPHLPNDSLIEHIGSTAVPGLGGKGIIDIAVAVDKESMEGACKELQKLGYEFRPSFSTPDRFYFIIHLPDPEEGSRRYHLHLTYPKNKEWKEFIGFRDFLRSHPEALKEYAHLKEKAALETDQNGEKYRKMKAPLIEKFNASAAVIDTRSMDEPIDLYRQKLNLPKAVFTHIDHEDAMVAAVFKITQPGNPDLILKVCSRRGDYLRESYFLSRFAGKLPVPRIIRLIEPETGIDGAVLMECLEGDLLKAEAVDTKLAYEIGSLLARIHLECAEGYGDLTDPAHLSADPRIPFTMKFEEGLEECEGHLPKSLLEKCRRYFDKDIGLLASTDGPCIIHRDFRPGNLIAANGKVQGIIDWSSGRSGFAEEDFCPLEFGEWPRNSDRKNSFLEGYASIRKIPDYKHIMPLLRLSRAVAAVGFTVKRETWNSRNAKLYQFNRQFLESL